MSESFSFHNSHNGDPAGKVIRSLGGLPEIPRVVGMLYRHDDANSDDTYAVMKIVERDSALTDRIMEVIKTTYVDTAAPVKSVAESIDTLGTDTIKLLVLLEEISSVLDVDPGYRYAISEIRMHSVHVAGLARRLAHLVSEDEQLRKDAFAAGLVHDIGKLLLLQLPGYFPKITRMVHERNVTYEKAEMLLLGTTHAEIGALLLREWGVPDRIHETTSFHHSPAEAPGREFSALTAVHIANALLDLRKMDIPYIKRLNLDSLLIEFIECYQSDT